MNVFLEPLPGLLDDPKFQIPDLPHLTDYHIAPLRDPVPSRSQYAPSPLEPTAGNNVHARAPPASAKQPVPAKRKTPKISPTEILLARDTKKPSIAISELIEAQKEETQPVHLPSFISLAIVERSPEQRAQSIDALRPAKRPRLDLDLDTSTSEDYRHLPLPSQKDGNNPGRTQPLLPAMVTGLHEPPPTAALLPSMATVKLLNRSPKQPSGLQVEPLNIAPGKRSQGRPPEQMLNSPEIRPMPLAANAGPLVTSSEHGPRDTRPIEPAAMETRPKKRRKPKFWTEEETEQLIQGVRKHGIGKWKQILEDPDLQFDGRSCVDLKDRFRVKMPDAYRDRELAEEMSALRPAPESEQRKEHSEIPSSTRLENHVDQRVPPGADSAPAPISNASHGPSREGPPQGQAPTTKNVRRKRRPWTTDEDQNLMRGVQRHGFQWTLIHDDPQLNLSHRKATDLRDRIRNMFPDGYRNADTRPKRDIPDGTRTLPPLVLDDDGDWDWSNNTLPPLLEWDDIGIERMGGGNFWTA